MTDSSEQSSILQNNEEVLAEIRRQLTPVETRRYKGSSGKTLTLIVYPDDAELRMTLIKGNVRIDWTNIGEGVSGDFDPEDPEDENLLRFDLYRRQNRKAGWDELESYCTNTRADTPADQLHALLEILMDQFFEPASDNQSVRRAAQEMSWISADWIESRTERFGRHAWV